MTENESPDESGEGWPKKSPGGEKRRFVLYGLLVVMLIALAYDYMVARPAVKAAYNKITAASAEANSSGVGFLSNLKVRELIGKEPSREFMDGSQTVEVFHWSGGLIVKPHKLYAVYKPQDGEWLFYRHSMFSYEATNQLMPKRADPEVPSDAEAEDYDSQYGGGGSGPGGPGGPGGAGGRRPGGGEGRGPGGRPELDDADDVSDEGPAESDDDSAAAAPDAE